MLKGKRVLVAICGGIAAYKAVDVVSGLVKLGAHVDVCMTKHACGFVTPLTLQSISKHPVLTDVFDEPRPEEIAHIALPQQADALLVVPATANMIGKIASGIADDLVSTAVLAATAKVLVAPSMNAVMYDNPVVQENLATLRRRGITVLEPDDGALACGTSGKGRLPKAQDLIDAVCAAIAYPHDLAGKTVLVTAGPTQESLDPVRYLTNHSSGKMGYAIAKDALWRGARVVLVSGPTMLLPPRGVRTISVRSACEMRDAVLAEFEAADIVVKAAAVGDFRPAAVSDQKIKKHDGAMQVELVKNPDILAELGQTKSHQVLVGFCMETEHLLEHAQTKLTAKNLDLIVANDLSRAGAGFGGDTNAVTILKRDGSRVATDVESKAAVAHLVLDCAREELL